ncbi:MAG: Ig-like domain-containing protein, partial [Crocinitomicaceae bacterium]|nr:Ig-like domain-containing protein [Crocinitomicaceae bacterium]
MVRKHIIIGLLGLLLYACAQVGTISGGDKDGYAPRPLPEKVVPPNETTGFQGNSVIIPFDEYFKLVNPAQNIRIVPPHANIKTSVSKKTLTLSWEEQLEENTTYAIYLNDAVKDVNEGNDTVIQYVFSTGPILDTLSYSTTIVDAWSNVRIDGCVVGLFDTETDEIVNFSRSSKGTVKLNYIRPGTYKLLAFMDENNDLVPQEFERIGYPEQPIVSINESTIDTVAIRLFRPEKAPKISSITFRGPGSFFIGSTRPIKNEALFFNGAIVPKTNYKRINSDSLHVFVDIGESNAGAFVLKMDAYTDTINYRISPNKRTSSITLEAGSTTIPPSEKVSFILNDFIESVDTSRIQIINLSDSSQVSDFSVSTNYNELVFDFDKTELTEIQVLFDEHAIACRNGKSNVFKSSITLNSIRKHGALNVDLTAYANPILLDVIR